MLRGVRSISVLYPLCTLSRCESAKVHVDGSDELSKGKHSTKNKVQQ